jgi:hypothetical protein
MESNFFDWNLLVLSLIFSVLVGFDAFGEFDSTELPPNKLENNNLSNLIPRECVTKQIMT